MTPPQPQDPDGLSEDDAVRWRRWFVCPVVGCHTIEEHDARDRTAHYCPSEKHPSTRLRVFFGGRLIKH